MSTRDRGARALLIAGTITLETGVCAAFGLPCGLIVAGALLLFLGWSAL